MGTSRRCCTVDEFQITQVQNFRACWSHETLRSRVRWQRRQTGPFISHCHLPVPHTMRFIQHSWITDSHQLAASQGRVAPQMPGGVYCDANMFSSHLASTGIRNDLPWTGSRKGVEGFSKNYHLHFPISIYAHSTQHGLAVDIIRFESLSFQLFNCLS